jgi:CheY-like chemotaxis protein
MVAERARYDQALAQIRTLEASQQALGAQLEESHKSQEGERHSYDRKIEALEAQIVREKQTAASESQKLRESSQQRIAELEMLIAGVEQEHARRMAELRAQVDEERHHSVDEQRTLKQEIQSLRMALADQQAHFAAERDGLSHEAKQVETRYVQLLEAERDSHARAREDWESTHEAAQQMLMDMKLELENTRFEQGMALARAHNETEQVRDEYEERLSSLSDQVMMLEEALMAPPPGISAEEELADEPPAGRTAIAPAQATHQVARELHSALLEWVAQQDQDEWHLELAAHDTPHVEMEWLAERLDEARRTCRDKGDTESIGFAIRTASGDDRTTLRMTRLSATAMDEIEDEDDSLDDLPPAVGNVARWLYDDDDRIGMEISFGAEAASVDEPHDGDIHDEEPQPQTLSVLVVEDQVEMQDILTDMISSLGHESALAMNAKDAYARYVNGAYDVVLISADLPQEEGHTLAQWIKSHRVEMPVIMMADAGARDMIEMVDSVLVKPFAIEQLHECLLTLTEGDFSGHVSVSGYDEGSDD